MAPPKEKERKRKFHRRSKNGCTRCKARHVRCDEQKPLCTNCLQTGSECIYPTPEQPLPSNESSPSPSSSSTVAVGSFGSQMSLAEPPTPGISNALNNYVGGSFDALPEPSKRLLRHLYSLGLKTCSPGAGIFGVRIQKSFENPGYMHMCLMLSACQWAWVTGSMDEVRIPFLYHKAATYQFAREQLQSPGLAQSGDTMLAISALALTEGAIGELDASSRHLKGIQSAVKEWNKVTDKVPTLPQRMLKMIGDGLRTGKAGQLVNVPEYQPTFMALLFASIWDITALPPREAPRYGWWEDIETPAARLWQNHTRDLNLNYEISRGFNGSQYVPRILNGDPKSSRTSFIATFFYLCSELGDRYFDVTMIDWLLEQLIDDVNAGEEHLRMSEWTQSLWLFCVLFGASMAFTGRANNVIEERQLAKWRGVYGDKMKLASRELGITSWQAARTMLAEVVGGIDSELEKGLEELWNEGISGEISGDSGISPAVIELSE
ncbi:Ff.00g119790.m01.CDS01 [Fusarium sp. VM40]|nr:Ff.00g119790.m01.CDS01 [Fusarium sp. VM40]